MKIQKKCMVLMILLVMELILPIKVKAEGMTSVIMSGPKEAQRGEELELIISVDGVSQGIQGLQATMDYNKDVLEYEDKASKKDNWFISGYNQDTGIFLAEVSSVSDENAKINGNTELLSFKFKVKETAKLGNTSIKLTNILASGAESLASNSTEYSVKIVDPNAQDADAGETQPPADTGGDIEEKEPPTDTGSYTGGTTSGEKDGTVAKNRIPQTGEKEMFVGICIGITMLLISYKKCKEYRDVK